MCHFSHLIQIHLFIFLFLSEEANLRRWFIRSPADQRSLSRCDVFRSLLGLSLFSLFFASLITLLLLFFFTFYTFKLDHSKPLDAQSCCIIYFLMCWLLFFFFRTWCTVKQFVLIIKKKGSLGLFWFSEVFRKIYTSPVQFSPVQSNAVQLYGTKSQQNLSI